MPRYQRNSIITHKTATNSLRGFGLNWFGDQKYRVVRASSRTEWCNGEYKSKYPQMKDAWILERYRPPDIFGDPILWEKSGLGPFPFDGDYMCIQSLAALGEHFEAPDGLQALADACIKTEELSAEARAASYRDEEENKKQERMAKLADIIHDARPLPGGEAERKYGAAMEEAASKGRNIRQAKPTGASLTV